jgi:hypothetical protein
MDIDMQTPIDSIQKITMTHLHLSSEFEGMILLVKLTANEIREQKKEQKEGEKDK